MAAGREVVKLGRNVGVEESAVVDESILSVALVVFGLNEEGRRSELVGRVDGIEGELIGRDSEVGRVAEDGEIGASVDVGIRFGGGGRRFDMRIVWVSAEEYGKIGTGGEADDSNVSGVDVPVGGVETGQTHGLLCVFQIGGVGGVVFLLGDAIFDEQAGHADGVEPAADVDAFAIPSEYLITASRKD